MTDLRFVGGDIVALVQHVELNESGWVESATAKAVRFLFWLIDEPADSKDLFEQRGQIGLSSLTQAQVVAALTRLTEDGTILPTGAKFKLSEAARLKVGAAVSNAEAVEKGVIEKVIASARLATNTPELEASQLWSLFRAEFIIPFIREFGARAYELITGQSTNVGQKAFIAEFLANFDLSRKAILEAMILSLLDKNDEGCRSYILGLLNTHFYQTSVSLPPGVIEKVFPSNGKSNRLRLILDTNFIFSLFDLHSNPSNEAVSLLAKIIAKLPPSIDVRMYVLPTTIREFRKSLIHYEGLAKNFRPAQNIVEGALKYGVSGVLDTYFTRIRESGYKISADDYFRPYHDGIGALLSQHNVSILNGEDEKYTEDQDTIDDALEQDAFYKRKFINEPKRQKSYEQIWHDVLLWHYTADRRPTIVDTVFEAEWVGVTIDYGLLAFDSFKRRSGGVPVLVHPASLVQALQLLVPQDENLERAILALMQMPFLFEAFDPSDERVTQKILSTLSRFDTVEDLSSETIMQLLGNRALRGKMETTSSKDEEIVLIRDAIIDHAADAEKKMAEAQEKLKAALYDQESAQERLRAMELALENDRATRAIEAAAAGNARATVERENQRLQAELREAQDARALDTATRHQLRAFVWGSAVATVVTILLALLAYNFREPVAQIARWAPWALGLLALTIPTALLEYFSRRWSLISTYPAVALVRTSSSWLLWLVVFLILSILAPLVWELVKEDVGRWLPMLDPAESTDP